MLVNTDYAFGTSHVSSHIKPIATVALFVVALFSNVVPAFAEEKIGCSSTSFSEVRSLEELPEEVGVLLGKDHPGRGGIADRNGKFNLTDLLMPGEEQLPFRRFSLAAVSTNCILVAVEHGGRGYSVELWAFERSNDRWLGEQRKSIFSVPRSLKELVAHASK
jgi:hypothetical protein